MTAATYSQPSAVQSGVRSAVALLLPEPYVHLSAHTALHSALAHERDEWRNQAKRLSLALPSSNQRDLRKKRKNGGKYGSIFQKIK